MIEKLIQFVNIAAEIATNNQKNIDFFNLNFKSDYISSVVTETDLQISRMFKDFVKNNFSDLNYVIIDEESLEELGTDKFAKVEQAEYQFVIDPIDGTHTYALNTPNYAISIGVMKNNKPYMGVISLPFLGEAVAYDGEKSFYIKDGKKKVLEHKDVSRMCFIFDNTWWVKMNDKYDKRQEVVINLYSCIVHFFYMLTYRGKGYYFASYIWDMAGSWPILHNMGFEFFDYYSGKVLTEFSSEAFDNQFRIKGLYIVCRPEDFDRLKEIADFRP